jgi:hypothetical protein
MSPRDNDSDLLDGPVPAPDAEASAAERAHAKAFAELVDKTIAGRMPPAMDADERALLEVATVIRAGSGNVELKPSARNAIVEEALRQAIGGTSTASATGVVPLASARRRWLPWTVAASSALVAAAALIALFVRPPAQPPTSAPDVPVAWRSRPADALVGAIAREHAADADTRIDAIFADRLDGFRERRLGGLP